MKNQHRKLRSSVIEALEGRRLLSAVSTETASATIVASQLSATTYQYSITLKDTAHGKATSADQIETFWFAWLPGQDLLDTSPLTVSSPTGWTDQITNGGSASGYGIQWKTTSAAIKPGKTLTGFTFTSSDTPTQEFGKSNFFPTTLVNTAVVYSGAPFSDAGFTLTAVGSISDPTGALLPVLPVSTLVNATTVPTNGDVNPYGVAFVPAGFPKGGALAAGDVLVSNFNNSTNLQGTGTTIVAVSPTGSTSLFYHGAVGLGLSTALTALKSGFVVVGNVPTTDGTSATISQGSLIVLDKSGNQVASLTDPSLLDGPWDMTAVDSGSTAVLFVSNVLSGDVTRLKLRLSPAKDTVTVISKTQIASGYGHAPNSAALVVGPTGLAYDIKLKELFVASTDDNAIYAVPAPLTRTTDAGTGTLITQGSNLRGPLGLAVAPNGDLLVSNGDAINSNTAQPSELLEFTFSGEFVTQTPVDASGEGGAFGIAISSASGSTVRFAAVDDLTNSVDVWSIKSSLLRPHRGRGL